MISNGMGWRVVAVLTLLSSLLFALLFAAGCQDPDRRLLASMSEADEARFRRGRAVALPCWKCHDIAGPVQKVGPSLVGLYGRRSGIAPNFTATNALISASIVWDDRALGAFLSNPSGFIPGNGMVSPGVRDAAALSDLLFYLRRVTVPGAREARNGEG